MQQKQKIKGSILAYALIILSMMFAIVGALSITATLSKKDASSSDASVQALQIADSGAQWGVMQINNKLQSVAQGGNSYSDVKIGDVFSDCANSSNVARVQTAKYTLSFDLSFYDNNHDLITDCNTAAEKIKNIKSVGVYKSTVRAMEVGVVSNTNAQAINNPQGPVCKKADLPSGGDTSSLNGAFSEGNLVEHDWAGDGNSNNQCWKCQSGSWVNPSGCGDGGHGAGNYDIWTNGCPSYPSC